MACGAIQNESRPITRCQRISQPTPQAPTSFATSNVDVDFDPPHGHLGEDGWRESSRMLRGGQSNGSVSPSRRLSLLCGYFDARTIGPVGAGTPASGSSVTANTFTGF